MLRGRLTGRGTLLALAGAAVLALPGGARAMAPHPAAARADETPMKASWYGREQHRGPTASGQRYDMYQYTAAHRTLPLGTILRVRNPANGNAVRVVVNDRGPYVRGRDLDVSYAAARDVGLLTCGVARLYAKRVGHDSRYDRYWKHGVPPLPGEGGKSPAG